MSAQSEFLSTRERMSASEYQTASWAAYEQQVDPPDPARLSDHSLHAFLHYEGPELLLPSAARSAVEAEILRRGPTSEFVDQLTGLAMLLSLSIGGLVIGLVLLLP
jgi:hypothetical protein